MGLGRLAPHSRMLWTRSSRARIEHLPSFLVNVVGVTMTRRLNGTLRG